MLIRSIATEHGLMNGALEFVQHIEYSSNATEPLHVFVQFDDSSIGRIFHDSTHDAIPIAKISQELYV